MITQMEHISMYSRSIAQAQPVTPQHTAQSPLTTTTKCNTTEIQAGRASAVWSPPRRKGIVQCIQPEDAAGQHTALTASAHTPWNPREPAHTGHILVRPPCAMRAEEPETVQTQSIHHLALRNKATARPARRGRVEESPPLEDHRIRCPCLGRLAPKPPGRPATRAGRPRACSHPRRSGPGATRRAPRMRSSARTMAATEAEASGAQPC